MSNNDDWDSWENTPNTAEAQQDSWNSSSDDWGSSDDSQQNDWDSSENNTSNQNNFADFSEQSQEDYWEQQDNFINDSQVNEQPPKQFNFSIKTVGIILAGLFLIVALLLFILSSVKVKSSQSSQPSQTVNNQMQTSNQIDTDKNEDSTTSTTENKEKDGIVSMIEIPSTTKLDYNGEIYESNAQVVNKTKYLEGHQVIYCVVLKIVAGSSSEEVKYYCNYSSFGAVNVGDLVFVKYQQPQDGYISINEISK